MKKQYDFAQVGLVGCIIIILLAATVNSCNAQSRVSFSIMQDLKFATIGDAKRGYDAFTPNIVARFKMQGNQFKHGYLIVFPEFEYAAIEGNYYRYSANVGYSFNNLLFQYWTYTPAIGWGMIDRYGKSFFSFGASLEISYSISNTFNIVALNQLTERKDLLWLWGDNKIGYSFFVGLEIKL